MQRVKRSTAIATLPAPPVGGTPGFFTGGNPGVGQPASVPGYEWFNGVQEELIGLILRGGIAASDGDLAQVRKSLDRLFGGGLASLSANTTLTVDDAGLVLVSASGGARTITLPAANALGGRPIHFRIVKSDSSANALTVGRAGSDTIEGATSIVLRYQWESVTLASDGNSGWVITAGGRGSINAATPGWARLPNGLIFQWGNISGTTGAVISGVAEVTSTFTFPVAFPNAAVFAAATPNDITGPNTERGHVTNLTTTSVHWFLACANASTAMTGRLFAIGY